MGCKGEGLVGQGNSGWERQVDTERYGDVSWSSRAKVQSCSSPNGSQIISYRQFQRNKKSVGDDVGEEKTGKFMPATLPCLFQVVSLPAPHLQASTYLKLSRSREGGEDRYRRRYADTGAMGVWVCPKRIRDLHHEPQIPYGTVSVGIVYDDLSGMNAFRYLISRGQRWAQRDGHNQAHPAQASQGHGAGWQAGRHAGRAS